MDQQLKMQLRQVLTYAAPLAAAIVPTIDTYKAAFTTVLSDAGLSQGAIDLLLTFLTGITQEDLDAFVALFSAQPELQDELNAAISTIQASAVPAVSEAGEVQVGSPATCFARIENRFREVPIYGGVEERTQHLVILDETFPVSETDTRDTLFWLPGTTVTTAFARKAKIVHFCPDENGNLDHVEIYL